MPGYIQSVPGGVVSIYDKFQCTLHDANADKTALTTSAFDYQRRSLRSLFAWSFDKGYWPARTRFTCDPAAVAREDISQCGAGNAGPFAPWMCGVGGNATQNFIMGRCLDGDGNGVSGATVQAFRTADDAVVRETTADANGYYEAGTPEPVGTAHYLVAYRSGVPDIAGTTVNTLTATKRDGTAA